MFCKEEPVGGSRWLTRTERGARVASVAQVFAVRTVRAIHRLAPTKARPHDRTIHVREGR